MKPNDKVVCVCECFNRFVEERWGIVPSEYPKLGQVYTVREVMQNPYWEREFGLRLVGIYGGSWKGQEWAWNASRFRLVSKIGHPPIAVKQETEVQG